MFPKHRKVDLNPQVPGKARELAAETGEAVVEIFLSYKPPETHTPEIRTSTIVAARSWGQSVALAESICTTLLGSWTQVHTSNSYAMTYKLPYRTTATAAAASAAAAFVLATKAGPQSVFLTLPRVSLAVNGASRAAAAKAFDAAATTAASPPSLLDDSLSWQQRDVVEPRMA